MVGTHIVSRPLALCAMVLGLAAFALPAAAQTGSVRGKVTDADNKPVDGAKVTIQLVDNNTKFEVKSNKKGEFMQIGLQPGQCKISAEKEGLSASKTSRISLDVAEVNLTLTKGGGASAEGMSKEDRAKAEAKVAGIKAAYAEAARWPIRQVRRVHRQVQRGPEGRSQVHRVLHRDRHCVCGEEGLRRGRGGLQEGARNRPEFSRSVQRAGDDLQLSEEIRSSEGDERRGDEARHDSRRLGRCGLAL